MATSQRPAIFEALRLMLQTAVPEVESRVFLPWDAPPQMEDGLPFLEVSIDPSRMDADTFKTCVHTLPVRIGCVMSGKVDYRIVWDTLADVAAGLIANSTLAGTVNRISIDSAGDQLTLNSERIYWPHLAVTLTYYTAFGQI